MERSALIPFVRENLDILFVGLNPAVKSSRNRHYFSVNQAFWNQLYKSGLITRPIDKMGADEVVFGSTSINYRGWSYGITDLYPQFAESDSKKIMATRDDCERLRDTICKMKPKTAVLLHGKVCQHFLHFLGYPVPDANSGQLGKLIVDCPTMFFNIAFPHGNTITSVAKVHEYRKVRQYLCEIDGRLK
jgi:hypothetical protein